MAGILKYNPRFPVIMVAVVVVLAFAAFLFSAVSLYARSAANSEVSGDGLREGADPVREIVAKIGDSNVTFDYSFVMDSDRMKVKGSGKTVMQGDCYFVEGNGLRVWCDGTSAWTMDVYANEVVIEPSDGANGLSANPLLMLANCDKLYEWDSAGSSAKFGDAACRMFVLVPKVKTDFSEVRLYLQGDVLIGAALTTKLGIMTFTISSFECNAIDSAASFAPDSFPDDCIVTDLR